MAPGTFLRLTMSREFTLKPICCELVLFFDEDEDEDEDDYGLIRISFPNSPSVIAVVRGKELELALVAAAVGAEIQDDAQES
jgi:hypothetical protein